MNSQQPDNTLLLHGVFLVVDETGVLLSGKSGIGKSELALGLLSRKHQLVADDSIEFERQEDHLLGRCPQLLQDFLEVRGLGILNIRKMFGDSALCQSFRLDLIINVFNAGNDDLYKIDRLNGLCATKSLLGVNVKEVSLPVAPGRNLAILVESAVMNHKLQLSGYYAVDDFTTRHKQFMHSKINEGNE